MLSILLIVPPAPTFYGKPRYPVLGLSMIGASLLRAGYNVRALDLRLQKENATIVTTSLASFKPAIVGFTVTNWDFASAIRLATMVKRIVPGVATVFGGPQPTLCPVETIRHECVDFVVRGEGELTIVELAECIVGDRDFMRVGGIVFKNKSSDPVFSGDRVLVSDLSTLPLPAFDLFDLSAYRAGKERRLGIYSTRGCPYGCIFCTGKTLMGRKIRCRPPEEVVAEMRYWHERVGVTHFNFLEDNCFGQHGHGERLLTCMEQAHLPVTYSLEVGVRADALTDDICRRLKQSGCTMIAIGIESVDPDVLLLSHKGETIEEIRAGIRAAKKAGLFIKGYFIVGLPGDTPEKVRASLHFADSEEIDMPRFALAQAFPHTELAAWVRENGHFYYEPYDYVLKHTDEYHGAVHYDFPGFSKQEIWKMYRWAHKKALALAFHQALRRRFGVRIGDFLNLFNWSVVRNGSIWLYQHKLLSLNKMGKKSKSIILG